MGRAVISTHRTEEEANIELNRLEESGEYKKGQLLIYNEPDLFGPEFPFSLNFE